MNKDVEKFLLVAYSKNDFNNRKYLTLNGKKGCFLASIDSQTSKYSKENLYKELLEKNVIREEHTEFVIWFKQKDVVKQLPVIFNNDDIRMYSEYLLGFNDEDHTEKFDIMNENLFQKFVHFLDIDSDKYDKLSYDEQIKFMDSDSFTARFCRLPFALSESKNRVEDRILGPYQYKEEKRVKSKATLNRNYHNLRNEIRDSYRSFRDKYIFLNSKENFEELYKDLKIEDLNKKIVQQDTDETQEEVVYGIRDYVNLLTSSDTRESFNDFIYNYPGLPKKTKDYTNRLAQSMFDSDSEDDYSVNVIYSFSKSHPGVINELIHEFNQINKSKHK